MSENRAAWLAERKLGVGGSDLSSVFNLGYGCRKRLWLDKTGVTPDFPREDTLAMQLGRILEPFAAEQYSLLTGRAVSTIHSALVHPTIPELRVNVDRMIMAPQKTNGVLELKAVGRAMFFKSKREGLWPDAILQLQHAMVVTGTTWGAFGVLSRDSGELLHWDVDKSESIEKEILAEVPKFWAQVENGPMPDALPPDDNRCQSCEYRTQCQGNALPGPDRGSGYEADESLRPLVLEYIERRALKKEATDLLDETKAELEYRMGERGMVTAAGAKIQFYKFTKKEYVVKAHEERPLRVYEAKAK